MLSLALQESDENKVDLKQFLQTDSEGSVKQRTVDGLTADELKDAEAELSKALSEHQLEHAMSILRAFRVGSTEEEKQEAVVSFKTHARLF